VGETQRAERRVGLVCGLAAYGLWGLMPLYFGYVRAVSPQELLAQRVVWSALVLGCVVSALGRWGDVLRCLGTPRLRTMLLASTLLLAINWFVFLYGVAIDRVVDNSLGYFINPLLNILLGVLFFRERLRPLVRFGFALASLGLVYLVVAIGGLPWIALVLAFSFAGYGLLRKLAPVDALVGLTVETLLLLPFASIFLAGWANAGYLALGSEGVVVDGLIIASGVVTAGPLLCFGAAARRLPLSILGFLQYLAPSLQLILAVLWFGEPFTAAQQVCFGCIWVALALVTVDSLLAPRLRGRKVGEDAVSEGRCTRGYTMPAGSRILEQHLEDHRQVPRDAPAGG
jgi:chloramphenicol-sensitive protein RarD